MELPSSGDCFTELYKAYSEPHRHYHTTVHIDTLLTQFKEVTPLASNTGAVELAIWFHDAIYKPFANNNEEKSALWAKKFLLTNNARHEIIDTVYQLVMATSHDRNANDNDNDQKLIVDLDLSILGTDANTFNEYEKQIRSEYRKVPGWIYRRKRLEILKLFLDRDRIFQLDYFYERYERSARSNLKRVIKAL